MAYRYGSKEQELDRTAEMFLENCAGGKFDLAFWLVYDSNRLDPAAMKFLAERIQERHQKGKT